MHMTRDAAVLSWQSYVVAHVDPLPKRTFAGIAGHATNWCLHLQIYNDLTSLLNPSEGILWYVGSMGRSSIKMVGSIGADNDNTCHGKLEAWISRIYVIACCIYGMYFWRNLICSTIAVHIPDLLRLSAIQSFLRAISDNWSIEVVTTLRKYRKHVNGVFIAACFWCWAGSVVVDAQPALFSYFP